MTVTNDVCMYIQAIILHKHISPLDDKSLNIYIIDMFLIGSFLWINSLYPFINIRLFYNSIKSIHTQKLTHDIVYVLSNHG